MRRRSTATGCVSGLEPRTSGRHRSNRPSSRDPLPSAPVTQGSAIRFMPFAGRRVAYAVTGDGPPIVAPAWWVSHLELDWELDTFRALWESVASGYTFV